MVLCQLPGNATLVLFPGTPSGNCNSRQLALDQSNGSLYTCINAAATNQGTWQIVAGGGPGGGGWNPPAVGGDTIFGNNTVGTSVPSFFIPGGDVSFSSGNFSVNQLHFGPNSFALTNTGIATGNCLQVSDGSIIGGACGTGGGGGLSGSGGVNAIAKFTAATTLGSSLLSDDGTTLTYTGTGGIVAPRVSITQGPFQLQSVTGSLPSLPGAGQNALVSGTDGWYVSNANGAFFKIEPPGTAGTGGAVSSVFNRTGAVVAQTGDYTFSQIGGTISTAQIGTAAVTSFNGRSGAVTPIVGDYTVLQVSGAAPLASPSFTGTPTAGPSGSIPATDDSTRLATTEWVKANFLAGGGGGGGQTVGIGPSAQPAACYPQNTYTTNTLTITSLNIQQNDTVLVSVGVSGASNASTVTAGGATYTQVTTRNFAAGTYTSNLLASAVGAAPAATSMTVTNTANGKFIVCIAAFVGVNSLGVTPASNIGSSAAGALTTASPSLAIEDANGFIFASVTVAGVATQAGGSATSATSAGNSPSSTAICENTLPAPGTASCNVTWTVSTALAYGWTAVELRPGVTVAPLWPGPKVVAYHKANVTVTTTAATDTAFFTCSATQCPPGYYRVTWDFLSLGSGCTNGTVIVNIDYYDEYDLNTVYHTGIGSASAVGLGRNHVFWNRLQTVAKTIDSTTGISFTTTTTPCSSGTGTAQQTVSVERLQ